ncbi:MAG: hypothetical protein ACXAC6_12455 [Candidatus Hodarchaeales archaeon]|jgi:hypothetical protein
MNKSKTEPPVIRKNDEFHNSKLFTFYSELPQFKFHVLPEKFNESPIRPAIMKVLREGIPSEEGLGKLRYALNAQEIKEQLSNNPSSDVKNVTYTNLYFHLKKMLEVEVIQIVAYVIERSHRIAFYGRSARLIFFNDPSKHLNLFKSRFEELTKLLTILDPKMDEKAFGRLSEQYYALEEEQIMKIAKWMADNEGVISKNRLNIDYIYKALKTILDFENTGNKSISEVMEQMKYHEREVE